MFSFTRFSLARQFLATSLVILLIGMLAVGYFVSLQIETGVINQTAMVTALYVDSFIAPIVQKVPMEEAPDGIHPTSVEHLSTLDQLLSETPLGQNIVAFKLWLSDGEIIYSPNPNLVGVHFPIGEELARAFEGEVVSAVSQLDKHEHMYERLYWDTLIETYSPVRSEETGEIIAVAEFYILPDDLKAEIRTAQIKSWLMVGAASFVMYVFLAGMVGRASQTILKQQDDLQGSIAQLQNLLSQNEQLRRRVHRAAARTTALNEQFLRRVSSDLHDGPTQDLALALLRIDPLSEAILGDPKKASNGDMIHNDLRTIQNALEAAITDIRAISAGLRIPKLEKMSPVEVIERAIKDYERITNLNVSLEVQETPPSVTESVKITLYRLVQEALSNSYRHAKGAKQSIRVKGNKGQIEVEIEDDGSGFDIDTVQEDIHLGLVGMRERVEVLGGEFTVITDASQGTKIIACIPLYATEDYIEDAHD